MATPVVPVETESDGCPRCGAALRFADDDGTRECVCGWSERTTDPLDDLAGFWDAPDDDDSDDPLLV